MKSLRFGTLGRPWQRLRDAAGATFLVHVVITLLALVPTYPLVMALGGTVANHPRGERALLEPGGAVLLEALDQAGDAIFALFHTTLAVQLVALALAPFLALTWLAALARPQSLAASISVAAGGYLRAVGAAGILLVPAGLAVGLALLVPTIVHLVLEDLPDARVHDVLVFLALLVGLAPLAVVAAWHDLTRAAIVRGARSSWRAVLEGLIALRGGAVPAYVTWMAIGLALLLLGHLIGIWLDSPSTWTALLLLFIQQLIALARTLVRGRWLATAVEHAATVQPSAVPPKSVRPPPPIVPAEAAGPPAERMDPSVPIPLERPSRPGGIGGIES
jgi:hypothetical protein